MTGRGSDNSGEPTLRRVLIWAALTFAMAGAAGATGYLVANANQDAPGDPSSSYPPLSSSPGLVDVGAAYGSGHAVGGRSARGSALVRGRRQGRQEERFVWQRRLRRDGPVYRRIFESGRAAGSNETLRRFAFSRDGIYAVGVGGRGREVNARYGPLRPGASYALCKDGTALCNVATRVGRP